MLLFNANLLHAGSITNVHENNPRIQMKFTHKDDRKVLSFYENYTKIVDKDINTSKIRDNVIKHFTCQHPFAQEIANKVYNYDTNKKEAPKWFLNLIYGNTSYL